MILYINACVRKESRTKVLADHLIGKLLTQAERKGAKEEVEEVDLGKVFFPVASSVYSGTTMRQVSVLYKTTASAWQ